MTTVTFCLLEKGLWCSYAHDVHMYNAAVQNDYSDVHIYANPDSIYLEGDCRQTTL